MKIFDTPTVPVSWGELIDKITILEIKLLNIKSQNALVNINKELLFLKSILNKSEEIENIIKVPMKDLSLVNMELWRVEDDLREKESLKKFDNTFIELARKVYKLNDERSVIKRHINIMLNSELVEEKSYQGYS
jgi:hypothetical protein